MHLPAAFLSMCRDAVPAPIQNRSTRSSRRDIRREESYGLPGPKPRKYSKPIEMRELLRGKDLTLSAAACPEFKALLNTLLTLSGLTPRPLKRSHHRTP